MSVYTATGFLQKACEMTPQLELVFELNGVLEPTVMIGETPHGTRRTVPITGGTFEGPNFRGTMLRGGTRAPLGIHLWFYRVK